MRKHKKKYFAFIFAMLMMIILSVSLVACVIEEDEIIEETYQYTAAEAFAIIVESYDKKLNITDSVGSFSVTTNLYLGDEKYIALISGNIMTDSDSEFVFSLKDEQGTNVFSMYVIGDKLLLEISDTKVHIKDLDLSTIASKFLGADYEEIYGSIASVKEVIYAMLIGDVSNVTVDNIETINIEVKINEAINLVLDIVYTTGVDGLMELANITLPSNIDLEFLISNIRVPELSVMLTTIIEDGVNKEMNLIIDIDKDNIYNINATVDFYKDKQNIGIPEDVSAFESFSLTDFQFNVNLDLDSEKMDIGRLVNLIAGKEIMPVNKIVFSSSVGYNLKIIADLDVNDNSKNLALMELYYGDTSQKMIAGFYLNGDTLKLNIEETLPNYIGTPNLIIDDIDVSSSLKSIEQAISSTINGFIDGVVPSTSKQVITTASYDNNKLKGISPDIGSFIHILAGTVGFSDNIIVNENTAKIIINQSFFDVLKQMIPTVNVRWPLDDVIIDVNFEELDIHDINISLDDSSLNTNLNINLSDIEIGYKPIAIDAQIEIATAGKIYANSMSELITENLKGVNLESDISLDINAGEYDFANILKMFGINTPAIDISILENFKFDAKMKLQFTLDEDNPSNTKLLFELVTDKDNVFGKAGRLVGIYVTDNYLFVDFSNIKIANIKMPKIGFEVNITDAIMNAINDIDFAGLTNDSNEKQTRGVSSHDIELLDLLYLDIILNEKALLFKATSQAIQSLLKDFGMIIDLPTFDVTAVLDLVGTINVNISEGTSFDFNMKVNEFKTGKENMDIQLPELDENDYQGNLEKIMLDKFSNFEIKGEFTVDSQEGEIKLQNIINNILASSGIRANFPINLNLSDKSTIFHIDIAWALDMDSPDKSTLKAEISTHHDKLVFGLYVQDGVVYADLTSFGLGGITANNTGITYLIANTIQTQLDKVEWDLKTILDGLFVGEKSGNFNLPTQGVNIQSREGSVDYLDYLLQSISITGNKLSFDLATDIMYQALKSMGIDLGVDSSVNVNIDMETGMLDAKLALDVLELHFIVGVGERSKDDVIVIDKTAFDTFANINAASADILVDTILADIDPKLWIDLITKNIDTGDDLLYTRIAIEKVKANKTVNGITYNIGDYMITIFDGHSNNEAHVNIKLDLKFKQDGVTPGDHIRIKLTNNAIAGLGEQVDLKIDDIGIRKMLIEALGPLFQSTEEYSVSTSSEVAIAPKFTDSINNLINGVDVTMHSSNKINAKINLNAEGLSDTLVTTLTKIFGGLNVKYDPVNSGVFADQLYDDYILPMIKDIAGNIIGGVGGFLVEPAVKTLLRRFLPLPLFTDFDIDVNMIDGKLAIIDAYGKDSRKGYYMDFAIYNLSAVGAIDWLAQDTNIAINSDEADIAKYFEKQAKIHKYTDNGTIFDHEDIVWDYDTVIVKENDAYVPGVYTVTGTAFSRTIVVNVVVEEPRTITSISDVKASVYGDLPTCITVNYSDGTSKVIRGVNIIAPPTGFKQHNVIGTVAVEGVEYDIKVDYEDATIGKILSNTTLTVDLYDYFEGKYEFPQYIYIQYLTGFNASHRVTWDLTNIASIDATGGTFDIYAIIGSGATAQTMTFKIEFDNIEVEDIIIDGNYNKIYVNPFTALSDFNTLYPNMVTVVDKNGVVNQINVVWDLSTVVYSRSGGIYIATIKSIINGKELWSREIQVNVLDTSSAYMMFNDSENIMINPLDYFNNDGNGTFNSNALLMFGDASTIDMSVVWNIKNTIISYEGGNSYATATIATGTAMERSFLIQVIVERMVPEELVLEGNEYIYNTYDTASNYNTTQNIKYSNGEIIETQVVWDTNSVVVDLNGGSYKASITFGKGAGVVTLDVAVRVRNMVATGGVNSTIEFSYDEYVASQGLGFFNESIEIQFKEIALVLPVEWDIVNLLPTAEGGEFIVYASFGTGEFAQIISINVIVTATVGGTL